MLELNKVYVNNKNGLPYRTLQFVKNCTNAQEGQQMITYVRADIDESQLYVRDFDEFSRKFTKLQT